MSPAHALSASVVAIVLVAVACGGAAAPTATKAPVAPAAAATATPARAPAATTAAASGKATGKVIIAVASEMLKNSLDPATSTGVPYVIQASLYEPFAFLHEGNYETPVLAASWKLAEDARSWTFQLRKGVKFHNGEDFDAQVMIKNMKRAKGIGSAAFHENVDGYETPDSHTLVLRVKKYDLALVSRLSWTTSIGMPAPARYIDEVGEDGIQKHPIGTGPYKFVSLDTAVGALTLEAWDEWGGYWGFKPTVKTVVRLSIPQETTRVAMLATGEADIAGLAAGPQLREVRGATVYSSSSTQVSWLEFFKQADPTSPYSDVRVRQALNYAVDKQTIIDKVLGGAGEPVAVPLASFQNGFPRDIKPYPYDPEKAKRLLAEAGFAGGFDGGTILTASAANKTLGEAIAPYLEAIGVRVQVQPIDAGTLYRRWNPPAHDLGKDSGMGFLGSNLPGDSAYRIESFFTKYGIWGYTVDPELDRVFDQTFQVRTAAERDLLMEKAARTTHEKAYKLFLWSPKAVFGWGPRIADWRHGGIESGNAPLIQSIRLK